MSGVTRFALVLLILLSFTVSLNSQLCEHLVWHDEFRSSSLDLSKWDFDIGTGNGGWGNNELQYYTSSSQNVKVEDGLLKICALDDGFGGMSFTSARIVTRGKFAFNSGRVEAKVKLPSGQGIWPAFWMLPEDNVYGTWPVSGEIDIIEMLGQDPNKVYGTVHYGRYFPNNQMTGNDYIKSGPNFSEEFHVFSFEWKPDTLTWSVDGVMYNQITRNDIANDFWPFDQDMHFLLNVAVGGNWPGPPNTSTTFPAEMHVDYIRVFQKPENLIISGSKTVLSNTEQVEYRINPVQGSNYVWTVPADASIESGQGTNEILVNWGSTSGTVEVETDKCCCLQNTGLDVSVKSLDCSSNIYDSNGNKELHWVSVDGNLNELILNPASNTVNSSSHCARYDRNPGVQYDVLRFLTNIVEDASNFESGNLKIEMDVYTSAPVGTEILVQFENHELAQNAFPTGRHSIYQDFTTAQNQWHTLSFDYLWSPDSNVEDKSINDFLFLFAPNSNSSDFFYFDNLRIVDSNCQ